MKEDEINAVQMVRLIREAHYKVLKGKNREDRKAFYRAKAEKLHFWLNAKRESQTGACRTRG